MHLKYFRNVLGDTGSEVSERAQTAFWGVRMSSLYFFGPDKSVQNQALFNDRRHMNPGVTQPNLEKYEKTYNLPKGAWIHMAAVIK